MGATTEELKAEIEQKRLELGADIEALGARVSPGQIAKRTKAEVRLVAHQTWDRFLHGALPREGVGMPGPTGTPPPVVGGNLTDNPLAVAAIGFAAGLLFGIVLDRRRLNRRVARVLARA